MHFFSSKADLGLYIIEPHTPDSEVDFSSQSPLPSTAFRSQREVSEQAGRRGATPDTWACLSSPASQWRRALSLGS